MGKPKRTASKRPASDLVDLPTALAMAGGVSDSTRRRDVTFPKPVVLSRTRTGKAARVAFVRSEVLAWCAAQIARRDAGEPAPLRSTPPNDGVTR